jgi:mono/diheme cytochrome c family protein
MRNIDRVQRLAIAAVAAVGMFTGVSSLADEQAATLQDFGKGLYLQYCSSCHGPDGKGDGFVSGFLTPKPANLTLLAQKHGGQFPYNKVVQIIDGRNSVRAHGDPAMPVWGETLEHNPSQLFSQKAQVQGKIQLITDYLRSIQQK